MIHSGNLLSAGFQFHFEDDPQTRDIDYLKTTYDTKEVVTSESKVESLRFWFNSKVTTINRTVDRTSSWTNYYWNRKETVVATAGGNSQEGSTALIPQKQKIVTTNFGPEKSRIYSNSMNNSEFLYVAQLSSAYAMFIFGVWEWAEWDFVDYTDYRDAQWEKYENIEATLYHESILAENGYSGSFVIDVLLDDTMKSLLLDGDPLNFNLFGKVGDANFTSARLWAKYDDGIPAVPETVTLILLGFGLAGLVSVSRKRV